METLTGRAWRSRRERRRLQILSELNALRHETHDELARRYIDDMILYAEIGRDRRCLPDDYAAKVRAFVAESTGRRVP